MEHLDDRERIALRARITTGLVGFEQPQPMRCEVGVEDFLRKQRSSVNRSVFGRKAATIWRELHPGEEQPTKRIVLGNGHATDAKIYYEDEIETVLLPALRQCTPPAVNREETAAQPTLDGFVRAAA